MSRDYQFDYSHRMPSVYDIEAREKKAQTTVAVLEDYFEHPLKELRLLDVGSSTGIIDHYLAGFFREVVGIDIDADAIQFSQQQFQRDNLDYRIGDAMALDFPDGSFDIIVCSHVYEHVSNAQTMMDEIYRVLRPGGVCYFAGNNRLMYNEPHYNLPLLSVMPRPLANLYMRLAGKGSHYYEKHLSFWSLKKLAHRFQTHDYTQHIIYQPEKYKVDYMLKPGSLKASVAKFVVTFFYWASPYIWLLEKPSDHS